MATEFEKQMNKFYRDLATSEVASHNLAGGGWHNLSGGAWHKSLDSAPYIAEGPQKTHFTLMPCNIDILGGFDMFRYAISNAHKAIEDLPNINDFPDFFEIPLCLKHTNATSKELLAVLEHQELFSVKNRHYASYAFKAKERYTNALISLYSSFLDVHADDSHKDYTLKVAMLYMGWHHINSALKDAEILTSDNKRPEVCYLGYILQSAEKALGNENEIYEEDFRALRGIEKYFKKRAACINHQVDYYEENIPYLEEIEKNFVPSLTDRLLHGTNKHEQHLLMLVLILDTASATYNYVAGIDKVKALNRGSELITTKFKDIDFNDPEIIFAFNKLRDFYSLRLGIHTCYQLKQGWMLHSNSVSKYCENYALRNEGDLQARFEGAIVAEALNIADVDVKSLNIMRSLQLSHQYKKEMIGSNYTDINRVFCDHMPCAQNPNDCLNLCDGETMPNQRSPCMLEDMRVPASEDLRFYRKKAGLPSKYINIAETHASFVAVYAKNHMIDGMMTETKSAFKNVRKYSQYTSFLNASLSVAMLNHMAFWGTGSREYSAHRYTPRIQSF